MRQLEATPAIILVTIEEGRIEGNCVFRPLFFRSVPLSPPFRAGKLSKNGDTNQNVYLAYGRLIFGTLR